MAPTMMPTIWPKPARPETTPSFSDGMRSAIVVVVCACIQLRNHSTSTQPSATSPIDETSDRPTRAAAPTIAPSTIQGLRLPHFERCRSEITPMTGWLNRPMNVPRLSTRASDRARADS